jgi:uncharacterized protein (TIGR02453 family)
MATKSTKEAKPARAASSRAASARGVSEDLLKFLKGLAKNNNREWFDAHRSQYDSARLEFTAFVRELAETIARFDPLVAGVDVHKCIFRVHRDVRFSKDKTPYKAHFSAFIAKDGKKSKYPGYYIHVEPGESMAAGGIYHPEPENLALIRAKAARDGSALRKILNAPAFRKAFPKGLEGDRLKSPPRTYAKDHPHADLLCMKDFIVVSRIPDSELAGGLLKTAEERFKLMLPLQKWLSDAVD